MQDQQDSKTVYPIDKGDGLQVCPGCGQRAGSDGDGTWVHDRTGEPLCESPVPVVTARVNTVFINRVLCACCNRPDAEEGSLIFTSEGFNGYLCSGCAVRHDPELADKLLGRLLASVDDDTLTKVVEYTDDQWLDHIVRLEL
jgi:hypothetical protein